MSFKSFFLIISIVYSLSILENLEYNPRIKIFQSTKDLSVFKIEEAQEIVRDILVGKWRKEEQRVIMYDKDILYPRNDSGWEVQVNDNFEVVYMDKIVDLLDNGYILSGYDLAEKKIKEKIKEGQFVIFIKEINILYVFKNKEEYKYAYYIFKINKFLVELYDNVEGSTSSEMFMYLLYNSLN